MSVRADFGQIAGEPPAQLDGGRELAALLVDSADRSGIRLGDDEHRWSMGRRVAGGNRPSCQEPVSMARRRRGVVAGADEKRWTRRTDSAAAESLARSPGCD